MKALVLAGGKGTRLRPLTYSIAKALIPVANRPIIHYVLQHLRDAGVRDVGVILAPETGAQVRETLSSHGGDLRLTYIVQDQPRGLADAVRVARGYLDDDPFVMYLGDNVIGCGIQDAVREFETAGADAEVLLKEVPDPRMFGVAELDASGRIRRLIEKPQQPPSNLALVGIYVLGPAIHHAIDRISPSARGELEITDAIQRLLDDGYVVRGKQLQTWWLDAGGKDDLLKANRAVLEEWCVGDVQGDVDQDSRIAGPVALDKTAHMKHSEVRGPVAIGSGSAIEGSFIGPYTSVGSSCVIRDSSVQHSVILDGARLEGVGHVSHSVIGRNAVVRRAVDTLSSVRFTIGDDSEVCI
jgi:glucose-1-phosphate thymidylyltransferase